MKVCINSLETAAVFLLLTPIGPNDKLRFRALTKSWQFSRTIMEHTELDTCSFASWIHNTSFCTQWTLPILRIKRKYAIVYHYRLPLTLAFRASILCNCSGCWTWSRMRKLTKSWWSGDSPPKASSFSSTWLHRQCCVLRIKQRAEPKHGKLKRRSPYNVLSSASITLFSRFVKNFALKSAQQNQN